MMKIVKVPRKRPVALSVRFKDKALWEWLEKKTTNPRVSKQDIIVAMVEHFKDLEEKGLPFTLMVKK